MHVFISGSIVIVVTLLIAVRVMVVGVVAINGRLHASRLWWVGSAKGVDVGKGVLVTLVSVHDRPLRPRKECFVMVSVVL